MDTVSGRKASDSNTEFMHHGSDSSHLNFYPVFKPLVTCECFTNCQWTETQGTWNWAAGRLPVSAVFSAKVSAGAAARTGAARSPPHSSLVSSTPQKPYPTLCGIHGKADICCQTPFRFLLLFERASNADNKFSVTDTALFLMGLMCHTADTGTKKNHFK